MNFLPNEIHKKIIKNTIPSMRWDFKSDFSAHKKKCKEKLIQLLGINEIIETDKDVKILKEETLNGQRYVKLAVKTEEDYYASCHLLFPKNYSGGRLPLCVCLQGHVSGAHLGLGIEKFPYDDVYLQNEGVDFCIQATNRGYIALAIEQRGFGENGGDTKTGGTNCLHPALTAILTGRTLVGERVWDVQRVLDSVLEQFSDIVTMENSVLIGMSGGGTATYYVACLDDRFDTYVPGVALCSFYDSIAEISHCACNYVPNMTKHFDMGDLAVLIAPKRLIVVSGTEDKWFPIDGAKREFERIKKIYEAQNATDKCIHVICKGGHSFYPNEAWQEIQRHK